MSADDAFVQLQINNSGAWKTVARFAADDEAAWHHARIGVERIALADAHAARWRIATAGGLPRVLAVFMSAGWREQEPRR